LLTGRAQHHIKVFPVEYKSKIITHMWSPTIVIDFVYIKYARYNDSYWSKIYGFSSFFIHASIVWSPLSGCSHSAYGMKICNKKAEVPVLPDGENLIILRSLVLTP